MFCFTAKLPVTTELLTIKKGMGVMTMELKKEILLFC